MIKRAARVAERSALVGGAPIRFRVSAAVVLLLVLASTVPAGRASPVERNVRGIHTLAASQQAINDQLTWAEALVGAGGHVTQPFLGVGGATAGPSTDALYYVDEAYRRQLDPILVLQGRYVNRDGCNREGYVGWIAPSADPGTGSYAATAEGYARFVAGLPRVDGRTLYVQIGNEPNLHEMWGGAANPAEYARFFVEASAAIRALGDSRVKILNAALAPEGDIDNLQFIGAAIEAESNFAASLDFWASHPYPRNQPPAHNLHDGTALPGSRYTIDAYLLELAVLAEHGIDTGNLQVILTETGWELGDTRYAEYPTVSDALRAEYAAQAFEQWARWPEIVAVTPFQLSGWYGTWRSFEWVHPSSATSPQGFPTQPRLQYARLLSGMEVVTGSVRDDHGTPIDGASIVGDPGGFQATSLPDGTFVLVARPGVSTLRVEKDGYGAVRADDVQRQAGGVLSLGFALPAQLSTTLQNASFEEADLGRWTRWGAADGVQVGPWFFDVAAQDGAAFLGTAVNCGAKDGGVYQTIGARPDSVVTVEALALTYRDGSVPIGSRIGIDPWGGSDPRADRIVWSPLVETAGQWLPVTIAARAETDRVTIFLEHDQDAANPWNVSAFDDVRFVPSVQLGEGR